MGEGDPIHLRELEDEHAEARFVAGEIERLVDGGGSRDEVAVFYRTNAQSRVLEDTLVRYGVGYQVIGGTRFYERAEIKDALAYLTLLVNPHDVVAFERDRELAAARHRRHLAGAASSAHANTLGEPIWDVARRPRRCPGLGAAAREGRGPLHVRDGDACASAPRAAPVWATCSQETLDETGYVDALEAERTIEAQGRLENLEELVGVAREYDAAAGRAVGRGVPPAGRPLLRAGQPAATTRAS